MRLALEEYRALIGYLEKEMPPDHRRALLHALERALVYFDVEDARKILLHLEAQRRADRAIMDKALSRNHD